MTIPLATATPISQENDSNGRIQHTPDDAPYRDNVPFATASINHAAAAATPPPFGQALATSGNSAAITTATTYEATPYATSQNYSSSPQVGGAPSPQGFQSGTVPPLNDDLFNDSSSTQGTTCWSSKCRMITLCLILIIIGVVLSILRGIAGDGGSKESSTNVLGQSINGKLPFDRFGWSLDLNDDGSIVAIGAVVNPSQTGEARSGTVRVYVRMVHETAAKGPPSLTNTTPRSSSAPADSDSIGDMNSSTGNEADTATSTSKNSYWTQLGQVIDSENKGENFGGSISLSSDGTVLAIGDHLDDVDAGMDGDSTNKLVDAGSVRVYRISSLSFSDSPPGEKVWEQIGQDIDGGNSLDWSGRSVALSDDGTMVAIGTIQFQTGTGYARVYKLVYTNSDTTNSTDAVWTQMGSDIRGEEGLGSSFGFAVDFSGDGTTLVVGDYRNAGNGVNAGSVRIYRYKTSLVQDGGDNENDPVYDWVQQGQDIDGDNALDWFGWYVSVSRDGSVVAVGAVGAFPTNGASPQGFTYGTPGYVRVYGWQESSNRWEMIGPTIDDPCAVTVCTSELFGRVVRLSADGNRLAVADPRQTSSTGRKNVGSVRVYQRFPFQQPSNATNESESQFVQVGTALHGLQEGDYFGHSLAFSGQGDIVAVGAPGNDESDVGAGQVRIISLSEDTFLPPLV